ncbi:MAG: RNA polymerase sigma factor [Myxococcota bacterium]
MSGHSKGVHGNVTEVRPAAPHPPSLHSVYREHRQFVYRVTRQLGVSPHEAEDVVHDVFVIVGAKLDGYEGRGSLRSWLYGITRRVVSHHHRGERRSQRRLALVTDDPATTAPEPDRDPEDAVARAEAADLVEAFVEHLSPNKREIFMLALVEGLPAPAIAEATGINLNTIYARIRSVRRAFERVVARRRLVKEGARWSR